MTGEIFSIQPGEKNPTEMPDSMRIMRNNGQGAVLVSKDGTKMLKPNEVLNIFNDDFSVNLSKIPEELQLSNYRMRTSTIIEGENVTICYAGNVFPDFGIGSIKVLKENKVVFNICVENQKDKLMLTKIQEFDKKTGRISAKFSPQIEK